MTVDEARAIWRARRLALRESCSEGYLQEESYRILNASQEYRDGVLTFGRCAAFLGAENVNRVAILTVWAARKAEREMRLLELVSDTGKEKKRRCL